MGFSEWSGQAGYPNAGRMPRNRSATRSSLESFSSGAYQARRDCWWSHSVNAFRQAVCERLGHDRAVVVTCRLEGARELVRSVWIPTAKPPTWSSSPASAGATKSASERLGRESSWVPH